MIVKNLAAIGFVITITVISCKPNNKGQVAGTEYSTPEIEQLSVKINENPNDASLYATRGALWYEFENYDNGIADLEKAILLDSSKADYFHVLADMYMDYYKSRQGLSTLVRAANLFPTRIPTLLKLSEYQFILKQYNEALFTLERIRKIDPLHAEMFFMFGQIFQEMGKTDQAANAYQSAVENDPDLIDAWIKLAQIMADKKSPLAEKYFDNALSVGPNSIEALHAKAYFLSNHKNDLRGAIELYKRINKIDPQYEEGYFNAGLIYLDMDSVNQAFNSFDIAIKINPTFGEAYYYRGVACEKKGDVKGAQSDFKMAKELSPNEKQANK